MYRMTAGEQTFYTIGRKWRLRSKRTPILFE